MGILRVAPGCSAGTNGKPDDGPADAHFGEAIDVMDQLAADNVDEKALCLFNVAAVKAGMRKRGQARTRQSLLVIERATRAIPLVVEPAEIDRLASPSRRRR